MQINPIYSIGKGLQQTRSELNRLLNKGLAFIKYDLKDRIKKNEWYRKTSSTRLAREWLNDYVKDPSVRWSGLLGQGKLHLFDYQDPKYKEALPWYDEEPLVLSLGTVDTSLGLRDIGLNLHLLPPKVRFLVLTDIFNLFRKKYRAELYNPIASQKEIQVSWKLVMQPLQKYGVQFALRMYIPKRRKNTIVFKYEDWDKAIFIQSKKLNGINRIMLEREWAKFVHEFNSQGGNLKPNFYQN